MTPFGEHLPIVEQIDVLSASLQSVSREMPETSLVAHIRVQERVVRGDPADPRRRSRETHDRADEHIHLRYRVRCRPSEARPERLDVLAVPRTERRQIEDHTRV